MNTIDPMLQLVADELEIRNLQARLAHLADEGDLDEYITLFTDDAIWEGSSFGRWSGLEGIMQGATERRAGGTSGPGTHSRHVLTTTMIELDGNEASGRSVFHYYTHTNATPVLAIMGVYEDKFRRTEQGWKMSHRKINGPTSLVKPA
jgi:3-phenylpropionate/cinnamic acid dioxygenase small subunit